MKRKSKTEEGSIQKRRRILESSSTSSDESQDLIRQELEDSDESAERSRSIDASIIEIDIKSEPLTSLNQELLNILGDEPPKEKHSGSEIHPDIASRWQGILGKGLKKDIKDQIIEQYCIPKNCTLLNAPLLNEEVKVAISKTAKTKDDAVTASQTQIGTAIAAISEVLDKLVCNNTEDTTTLKKLSDACRILCNTHYECTQNRRKWLVQLLNESVKDTMKDSERDKYLFGENISEKMKSAKNIKKSGAELKSGSIKRFKQNYRSNNRNLNYQGPQQRGETSRMLAGKPNRSRHSTPPPPPPQRTSLRGRNPPRLNRPSTNRRNY